MPPSLRAFAVVCPYQTPRHDGVVGANLRVRPGEGEGGIEVPPGAMISLRSLLRFTFNPFGVV